MNYDTELVRRVNELADMHKRAPKKWQVAAIAVALFILSVILMEFVFR